MKTKLLGILVMTLLIATAVLPVIGTINNGETKNQILTGNIDWNQMIKSKELNLGQKNDGYYSTTTGKNGAKWVSFIPNTDPGTQAEVLPKSRDTMGLCVDSNFYGMYVMDTTVNNINFQILNMPNTGRYMNEGKPGIPIITRFFEVPHGVDISFTIIHTVEDNLNNYFVFPAQPPREDYPNATEPPFTIDWPTYNTSAFYPSNIVSLTGELGDAPIVIRGVRIVALNLHPVQFNPVTMDLKIYSKIEVKLEYNKPAQVEDINPRLKSREFDELCQALIPNYKYRPKNEGEFVTSPLSGTQNPGPIPLTIGAQYLIITEDSFFSAVEPLAEWKELKGVTTRIVKTSEISASPNANDIATYIQNVYDTWYPCPTFVLLVGDSDDIPPDYKNPHPSDCHGGFDTPTDLYYVTVDGSDYIPDMFIGRISVDNSNEAEIIVQKILNYERMPPGDPDFYTDVSACAAFQDRDYNTYEDRRFVLTSEEIRDYLRLTEGYDVERIYTTEGGDTAINPIFYNNGGYDNGDPLPSDLLRSNGFAWDGDTNDIRNAINDGRFLIYHRDHGLSENFWNHKPAPEGQWWGWSSGWSDPEFDTSDFTGLTNGVELPVIFSIECQCGWFDNEIDQFNDPILTKNFESFCEEITRINGGGAVAAIGACRNSQSGYNDDMIKGFVDAIWPGFDNDFSSGGLFSLGQVLLYGKMYMQNVYGYTDPLTKLAFENFHLFGDPEMQIWTDPNGFIVEYPDHIGLGGSQTFVVTVKNTSDGNPCFDAKVCLHNNAIHEVEYTDPAGQVVFDIIPTITDPLDITITKHNYIPFYGSIITVTGSGTTSLALSFNPDVGSAGESITISGTGFEDEDVQIEFPGTPPGTPTFHTSGGSFSDSMNVPPGPDGLVTVIAEGKTSGRTAVSLFKRLPLNRPELYVYCQDESTTWFLNPGNNPRWNSPCIDIYEGSVLQDSWSLASGHSYEVRTKVYNSGDIEAANTQVSLKWRDFGAGGPWNILGYKDIITVPESSAGVDGFEWASIPWTPTIAGHICIQTEVYHELDANTDNNWGQENTKVEHVSSPGTVEFNIINPTNKTVLPYIEVRQLGEGGVVWPAKIFRSYPQVQAPSAAKTATLTVHPPDDGLQIFTANVFIDGEMTGGIEFKVIKGDVENQPPDPPLITGPPIGNFGTEYTYVVASIDPEYEQIRYFFDWGDGTTFGWTNESYSSGEECEMAHTWNEKGTYIIKVKAMDEHQLESDWATLEVSMPKNKAINSPFLRFLENHPYMFPILRQLLNMQYRF